MLKELSCNTVVIEDIELEVFGAESEMALKNFSIPPRPATLFELQKEIAKDEPDLNLIARLVSSDVALTAALLNIVNSASYSLSRRCETVVQAINMLGLNQVSNIFTSLVLRKVLKTEGPQLTRFWDVSSKRSYAMSRLAKSLKGVDFDVAQSFGLFCDVGIPLLMQRFPNYGATLKACNEEKIKSFTDIEHEHHNTDHALIGAIMARSWGISKSLCLAIRLHHDYSVFLDPAIPDSVSRLIAMSLVSEISIQRYAGLNQSNEWDKGGDMASGALMLSDQCVEDWINQLCEDFSDGKN